MDVYFPSPTVGEIRVCVSVVCTARGPLVCFIHVKCLSDVLFFSSLFTLGLGDVNVCFYFFFTVRIDLAGYLKLCNTANIKMI